MTPRLLCGTFSVLDTIASKFLNFARTFSCCRRGGGVGPTRRSTQSWTPWRLGPSGRSVIEGAEMSDRSRSPTSSGPRPLTERSRSFSRSRSRSSSPIRTAHGRSREPSPARSPVRPRERAGARGGDDGSLYVSGLAAKVNVAPVPTRRLISVHRTREAVRYALSGVLEEVVRTFEAEPP